MDDCDVRGPWSAATVRAFLARTVIPMRIGVESPAGWPLVMSIWFVADGFELVGATRPTSTLIRALEKRPQCGFEIAADTPPYRGVRGHARVELDHEAGAATLDRLLIRYLGAADNPLGDRLRARAADEVCIRIHPVTLVSWDFTRRMASSLDGPTDR